MDIAAAILLLRALLLLPTLLLLRPTTLLLPPLLLLLRWPPTLLLLRPRALLPLWRSERTAGPTLLVGAMALVGARALVGAMLPLLWLRLRLRRPPALLLLGLQAQRPWPRARARQTTALPRRTPLRRPPSHMRRTAPHGPRALPAAAAAPTMLRAMS